MSETFSRHFGSLVRTRLRNIMISNPEDFFALIEHLDLGNRKMEFHRAVLSALVHSLIFSSLSEGESSTSLFWPAEPRQPIGASWGDILNVGRYLGDP